MKNRTIHDTGCTIRNLGPRLQPAPDGIAAAVRTAQPRDCFPGRTMHPPVMAGLCSNIAPSPPRLRAFASSVACGMDAKIPVGRDWPIGIRAFAPSCLTRRPSPWRQAFTLVELMAVMTIMLIMAVITIPAFAKMFQNSKQAAAMNEISAMIAQGHALALKMHQQVAVVFYEETQTGFTDSGLTGTPPPVPLTGETAMALAIAPQGQPENGSSNSTPLYFEPYLGTPVQYLPKGTVVAALTSSTVGLSGLNTLGTCRAIVFDASGHMVLRSYLGATANPDGAADYLDWQFISTANPSPPTTNIPTSSPGVLVYQPSTLPAADTTQPALQTYLTANNDVLIVNSYTGEVIR